MDEIDASHDIRLAFHLGPGVHAEAEGTRALLSWPGPAGPGAARLELPRGLRWSLHRGETGPILGWYSSGFGRRSPSVTLLGTGRSAAAEPFRTRLEFLQASTPAEHTFTSTAVSLQASPSLVREPPGRQVEAE